MEFKGQYLTYEEYKALGGLLDLTPFNLLEFEARKRIDIRTDNRLKNINSDEIPMEVKICEYKMINSASNYDEKLVNISGNVASESIDGYSVSYLTGNQITETIKAKEKELDNIIREHLLNLIVNDEHVLYCGVD